MGRITIDDVVDVIQEQAETSIQLMSGITEDVAEDDSVLRLSRARLPWLLVAMVGGLLGAEFIQLFDSEIILVPAMAGFIPIITATGGNVSARSREDPACAWITPRGLFKGALSPEIMVRMDQHGDPASEGGGIPSSESKIHAAILAARPDLQAVVHCLPPHATILVSEEAGARGKGVFSTGSGARAGGRPVATIPSWWGQTPGRLERAFG